MLGARLVVSAVLIPLLIGLLSIDARIGPTAPILCALCLLIAVRCTWELIPLLKRDAIEPRFGPVAACVVLLLMATWLPHWLAAPSATGEQPAVSGAADAIPMSHVFGACVLMLMTIRAIRFREPGGNLPSLGAEVFAVAYLGLLLSLTSELRWLWPAGEGGYALLGMVIVAAKLGDVGAYTLGRLFGRRKMAPRLSPGKTWMGAVGAVGGGVCGALLWDYGVAPLFTSPLSEAIAGRSNVLTGLCAIAALGALLAIAGLLGDLCESLIKRDAGVKDSAALMPGFGGLLDLLDSILFAGPVALIACHWLLAALAG